MKQIGIGAIGILALSAALVPIAQAQKEPERSALSAPSSPEADSKSRKLETAKAAVQNKRPPPPMPTNEAKQSARTFPVPPEKSDGASKGPSVLVSRASNARKRPEIPTPGEKSASKGPQPPSSSELKNKTAGPLPPS